MNHTWCARCCEAPAQPVGSPAAAEGGRAGTGREHQPAVRQPVPGGRRGGDLQPVRAARARRGPGCRAALGGARPALQRYTSQGRACARAGRAPRRAAPLCRAAWRTARHAHGRTPGEGAGGQAGAPAAARSWLKLGPCHAAGIRPERACSRAAVTGRCLGACGAASKTGQRGGRRSGRTRAAGIPAPLCHDGHAHRAAADRAGHNCAPGIRGTTCARRAGRPAHAALKAVRARGVVCTAPPDYGCTCSGAQCCRPFSQRSSGRGCPG